MTVTSPRIANGITIPPLNLNPILTQREEGEVKVNVLPTSHSVDNASSSSTSYHRRNSDVFAEVDTERVGLLGAAPETEGYSKWSNNRNETQ